MSKVGLALASEETRKRVSKLGGDAPHKKRGLQGLDDAKRRHEIALLGGKARALQRRNEQA